MIFARSRIDIVGVAELRACWLDELSVKINGKTAVRNYEKDTNINGGKNE